jgi:hypothetical protein
MVSKPSGSEACCLPGVDGVTYLKIGSRGATIGMQGLDRMFQQLWERSCSPDEVSDSELVNIARQYNYIPHKEASEADHAAALRRAYHTYWINKERKAATE